MKNTKTCPKCSATTILRIPGTVEPQGGGNNIPLGWTGLEAVEVSRYLCTGCGYLEE